MALPRRSPFDLGDLPDSGVGSIPMDTPPIPRRPPSLEIYPRVGRSSASSEMASPEIPSPKMMGQPKREAPYAGSYKGSTFPYHSVTVKKGQTLGQIAKMFDLSVKDFMQANPQIRDPNRILAGAKLKIPKLSISEPFPEEELYSEEERTMHLPAPFSDEDLYPEKAAIEPRRRSVVREGRMMGGVDRR